MKKNYFIGLLSALMLTLFVTPAKANVTSMADLFGKYKFTATLEVIDESYAELFKSECDVTISKEEGSIYDAAIMGLGGATSSQYVSRIDTQAKTFTVVNPNSSNGLWAGSPVYVSNAEGNNPYETTIQRDFEFVYTYNEETKEITLPDFTVVTVSDWESVDATIVAKFSNVKFTLTEAENVEIADITGVWNFTSSYYDEESTFPNEFTVALEKSSNDNKNYNVTFNIEGYDAAETTATFNGVTLYIAFDSLFLDKEENIFFSNYAGSTTKGEYSFSYNSETSMTLTSGMSFIKLTTGKDEEGNDKVQAEQLQWFGMGLLKLPGDAPEFDWAGRYTVKGQRIEATTGYDDVCPEEWDFLVEYSDKWDMYLVTEFMGNDVVDLNYGGITFSIAEDGMSATIAAGTFIAMYSESPMVFLSLYNKDGKTEPAINVTRAEDGTITMEPIFIQAINYDNGSTTPVAFYQNLTLAKEESKSFSWAGSFTVTADIEAVAEGSYPSTFAMSVIYSEYTESYYVTDFLGYDITGMTYGGLPLTVAEDGKSATMALSGNFGFALVAGEYPDYIQLTDANNGTSPLTLTVNGDGTLSISDFALNSFNYDSNSITAKLAAYSNVKANVTDITSYDWAGTYLMSIMMPDAYYADEYAMKIEYSEYTESYYVSVFMGCELGSLNYGGLNLTVSESDPTKASIKLNGAYGVALLDMLENGNYLQLCDSVGGGVSLGVTLNADGSLTIDPFQIVEFSFDTFAAVGEPEDYPAAKAVKGGISTGIDTPIQDVIDATIDLNSEQPVTVYDAAGRKVYSGAANKVSELGNGLYIIKSNNASLKMYVK